MPETTILTRNRAFSPVSPEKYRNTVADPEPATGQNFVILSNQKPAKGQPCNGCGFCCQNEACELSVEWLKSTCAPCIALEWDGSSRYRCGLITRPAHYLSCDEAASPYFIDTFSRLLGIARGCDSEGGSPETPALDGK